MSGPAVPLSEHAARATESFARLLCEAEGGANAEAKHIDAAISQDLDSNLHNGQKGDDCADDGDGDGKRRVYSPSFLLKFKNHFTEPPVDLPKAGVECLITSAPPERRTGSVSGRRELAGGGRTERPSMRRGESARDIATLRLHRGRRSAAAGAEPAVAGRAGSPYPPGYSPPTAGRRPKTPGSPTLPRWKRPEERAANEASTLQRNVQRLASTSAPTTPRPWKRDEGPVKAEEEDEEDEEDFNPEEMEDKSGGGSWRRSEPPAEAGGDAPKAWTPRRRQGALSKDQEILSQVKGILNKLAVDNFHQLCGQLYALEVPSLEVLKGIIDVIFDKATLEPTFCSLYAQMCSDWANKAPKFKEPGSDRDMTFRRVLLNRCQVMFEKKKEGDAHPAKRVMIGNVIFIGELYRKKLITHKIIHICLNTLLTSVTKAISAKQIEAIDEDVECLCKLFIIVGRDLDMLSSDSRKQMEEYFRALKGIMNNKSLPSRIRFLVLDVVEFRQAGWAPKTAKAGK